MIKAALAKDIIGKLRGGMVPGHGLKYFAVGIEEVADTIQREWEDIKDSRSGFKFLQGPYGAGKTFLCTLLRERALSDKFAVSAVTVSHDTPLHLFEKLYIRIIDGLRVRTQPRNCALRNILEIWILTLENKIAGLYHLDPNRSVDQKYLKNLMEDEIESQLERIAGLDYSFAKAIHSYYIARFENDTSLIQSVISWLKGEGTIAVSEKRKFGVKGGVNRDNAYNFFLALLEIIRTAGYSGLLLIVDEVEYIYRNLKADLRNLAYQNIRLLLDKACQNALPGCYLLFTGTEDLFRDRQEGIPSYPALQERIAHIDTPGFTNLRQPVIRLRGFDRDKFQEVATRVSELHGIAYGWDASEKVPNKFLKKFAKATTTGLGGDVGQVPRGFLRELINILDLAQTRPKYDPLEEYDFDSLVQVVLAKEKELADSAHLIEF